MPISLRSVATVASLSALSVVLGACSGTVLESKKVDYRSAQQAPSLEVPPDLTAPVGDGRYAIPNAPPRGVATFSDYTADRAARPVLSTGAEVLPQVGAMRIERAGSQRWLVIPADANSLWPQVRDFWHELGFVLQIERPDIGVMETDWAEDRARIPQDILRRTIGRVLDGLYSTSMRDKFRTRMEVGSQGVVEIYISHRGMEEVYTNQAQDRTVWQPRAADPELEAEMLARLMVFLGAEEQSAQDLTAVPAGSPQATLTETAAGIALRLEESFDRAWRRVGLALDRSGFTVVDRDRSDGMFFVRYVDPDKDGQAAGEGGILSRLAFWRGNERPAADGEQYRIQLVDQGQRTGVRVLTTEGGENRSETARRILRLLHEQLR